MQSDVLACNREDKFMRLWNSVVACFAFGCLLLGANGIAVAGDTGYGDSDQSSPAAHPDDSYSPPDGADHPGAADDHSTVPQEDEGAAAPDDHSGDDAGPPPSDEPPE
jgi:hypothetical protein